MREFWLVLAALALAVSFLLPNHYQPWLAFHSELLAAWCLVPVAGAILLQRKRIVGNDLFWLGALGLAVALVQRLMGLVAFNGITALTTLYLLGFMLAALTGAAWQAQQPQQAERYIGTACLLAALVSLPIAVMQWLGWSWESAFLVRPPSLRPVANMAQPNLLADLFLLALCGLQPLWRLSRPHRFKAMLFFGLAALLIIGAALTGSRTGAVSVAALTAFALWQAPRQTEHFPGRMQIALLCLVFYGVLLAAPALQSQLQATPDEVPVFSPASSQSRLATWAMMSKALLTSPWTGFGWQQILQVNFVFADSMGMEAGMFGQAHNIFLDLMLWMGIPLGAMASLALVWVGWRGLRHGIAQGRWAACAMVLLLAIHALVEYPLQYSYFLLPFALLLGSLQHAEATVLPSPVPRMLVLALLMLVVAGLIAVQRDYLRIEQAFFALRYEAKGYVTTLPKDEPQVWVLDHMSEHIRASRADPSQPISDADLARRDRVTRVTPGPYMIVQLAKSYAYHGNSERAAYWLGQLCSKFSDDACKAGQHWWSRPTGVGASGAGLAPWPLPQSPLDSVRHPRGAE